MSLHIYIAHSGEHFLVDPISFASYVKVEAQSSYFQIFLKSLLYTVAVFELT